MLRHARSMSSVHASPFRASALVLALAAASTAMAADNGLQRYSPGIGGSDMTAPLVPGMYFQLPVVAYHANKMKGNDGNDAMGAANVPVPGPAVVPVTYKTGIEADVTALQPRFTYLSTTRVLGANLGFTAMLPIVQRKVSLSASDIRVGGAPAPAMIASGVASAAAAAGNSTTGFGDLEVSPILHWEIGDHQAVTLAPTLVLPTGQYDAKKRANPGYGNYYTFRPSIQYAFIGDGWDLGARLVLSFNTRNKDNGYYTGNIANIDWQAMKFVSDDVRIGLQGYFVRQYTKDTQDLSGFSASDAALFRRDIVSGNKMSVNGIGPAIAWLKNGGEMLVEGKFLQEFSARNRTEGQAFWLTVSKPL